MYKIAICEDCEFERNKIKRVFQSIANNKQVHLSVECFSSAEDFLNHDLIEYDLITLDIAMGKMDGITLAKHIRSGNSEVVFIFITSFDSFWPQGYKVNATRFLVKPLDETLLYYEIEEVVLNMLKRNAFVTLQDELSLTFKIPISKIAYIEIDGRKTAIYTLNNEKYLSKLKLDEWCEKLLIHDFSLTHNSLLVNMNHIKSISKQEVILVNEAKVCVSQRKWKSFKNAFGLFLSQR